MYKQIRRDAVVSSSHHKRARALNKNILNRQYSGKKMRNGNLYLYICYMRHNIAKQTQIPLIKIQL